MCLAQNKKFELIYKEGAVDKVSPYRVLENQRRPWNHSLLYPLSWVSNPYKNKRVVYSAKLIENAKAEKPKRRADARAEDLK